MSTYSEVADLLLGEMRQPDNTKLDKYVQDAADEIDSKLGMIYVTPVVIADTTTHRATILLLKRINNWLASGRVVLAVAAPSEQQYLHAYGRSLVEQASEALNALASGNSPLPGATPLDPEDLMTTGPVVNNLDTQSNVESFYNFFSDPCQSPYPYNPGVIYPGSRVL